MKEKVDYKEAEEDGGTEQHRSRPRRKPIKRGRQLAARLGERAVVYITKASLAPLPSTHVDYSQS
jgi:hypothetical protein